MATFTPLGDAGLKMTPITFGSPAPAAPKVAASSVNSFTPLAPKGATGSQLLPSVYIPPATGGPFDTSKIDQSTIPKVQPPPPVSSTMNASAIASSQTSPGITFPNNTPSTAISSSNANSSNTSIPTPIPTAESIIDKGAEQTPAETQQKSILDRIAGLIGTNKTQTTLTNDSETAAGVPAMTKTVNDLNTKLQGLNDQATALQNEANYTIPNQVQLDNTGSGVTKASTSARSADALRLNQIKQGAVATQALTVKSALYGAQGNLTLAKDAADKAATAQYEQEQQSIDYQKAQLDALAPTLSKEEKAQADIQKAALDDRQTKINNAMDDKKTIIALATAAIKNNPNDPAAQSAAQQALQESNNPQPDVSKAMALVGKYQSDPVATQTAIYQMQKARNEAIASAPLSPNDPNAKSALDPSSQSILAQTGLSVAAFSYLTTGTAALSRLSSTDRQKIMKEAQDFLNKNGLDYSTFQSQYAAQNKVVQSNIERAANTKVFGGEVSGTVSQFITDVGTDIPNLKPAAVAELFAKGSTNDTTAQKYAFDLQTMQNDLAGYYAASRGATSPDQADLTAAGKVITNGLSGKGAGAFKSSIDANIAKVSGVVNEAVTSAQKSVWDQFGVGDKYQSPTTGGTSTLSADVQAKISDNVTFSADGKTAYLPRSVWSTLGSSMDAILAEAKKDGYTLLVK